MQQLYYFILIILLRIIDVYNFILLAYALLSWFPQAYESRIGQIIFALVRPVLRPFRRFNLTIGSLDFTIFAVILLLNLLSSILIRVFTYG